MSSDDRPLSRWSRRKAEARHKRGSAAPAIEEPPPPAPPVQAAGPEAEAEAPAPPDLPDIESLTAESDFSQFLKEGVPGHLRTLAMRKLWASDPAFNVIDEMVEYGEDFTDGGMLVAGLKGALDEVADKAGAQRKDGDGAAAGQSGPVDEAAGDAAAPETAEGPDAETESPAAPDPGDDDSGCTA